MMSGSNLSPSQKLLRALVFFLVLSAVYLYPFPQANVFYPAVVLTHAFAGVLATILLVVTLFPLLRAGNLVWKLGWLLVAAGAVLGVVLIRTGTPHSEYRWLYAHILASVAGAACLLAEWLGTRGWLSSNAFVRLAVCLAVVAGIGWAARYQRETRWLSYYVIENPPLPPASMDAEGDGPKGPFFPSSAQVYGGQKIPSKFFMESDSCKRCHEDIYQQWSSSAHHFSSFNNQWYRKSIEYMQDVVGTKPSKWCGGCHDPAVLYAGKMDTPIKQIVHTPEAQAGLGCMMCHAIANVKSTMGQGDFYLEYPKLQPGCGLPARHLDETQS